MNSPSETHGAEDRKMTVSVGLIMAGFLVCCAAITVPAPAAFIVIGVGVLLFLFGVLAALESSSRPAVSKEAR